MKTTPLHTLSSVDDFPTVKLKVSELAQHINAFLDTMSTKSKATQTTYRSVLIGGSLAALKKHSQLQSPTQAPEQPQTPSSTQVSERSARRTKPRATFFEFFVLDRHFFFRVRDVERYKRHLAKHHKLQEVSVATYMTALRRFCQYLVEVGVLERNPAKRVQGGHRPTSHFRTFLQVEEIEQLLTSIETTTSVGLRDRAIIHVMLGCACSEVEIRQADVGDLRRQGKRWTLVVQGKGKSVKDEVIPVPSETAKSIQRYLATRLAPGKQALPPDAPMFTSYSNRSRHARITMRGIREAIMQRLKDSGVHKGRTGKLTPFSLRHTAGMLLVEQNATIEEVMHRMRIKWRPTAKLYFKQKGLLQGLASNPVASSLMALD